MELAAPIELGEGVDLRTDPGKRKDRPRDPEEDQRPAETDQLDDVHQHSDAVGDRVLARGPRDVVADPDRHLGDLQAVVADLDQDLGARAHPLAADVDRLDRLPPVGPETALGVGDREVVPGKRGRGVEDLHPYFPVGGDLAGRALDEPGADDDVVALPELGKQPGDVPRAVLAIGVDDDEFLGAEVPGGRKDRLERPAVALVGLMTDNDRAERLGDRDGLVRRAVVDDQDRVSVPGGTDDRLRDVGLLIVGRHRDKRPDGPPLPCEIVDEEGCVLPVVAGSGDRPGRAGGRRGSTCPDSHCGPSGDILETTSPSLYAGITAASPGSAAPALSGRERSWGFIDSIMVSWSSRGHSGRRRRLLAGGRSL